MADVIREAVVKLTVDDSGVSQGIENVNKKFSALSVAGAAAAAALATAGAATAALLVNLGRGEQVNNIASAFKNLQEQAGRTADDGINRLRQATQGLMSDLDLMRSSNIASQLGITPEMFEELAASAETLGQAYGKDLTESLDLLTQGFGRAQDRALKGLGITLDVKKAEDDFAKSIGTTRDKLNELGKTEAFRIAALEQVRIKTAAVTTNNASAADSYEKIEVKIRNVINKTVAALERNPQLAKSFDDIGKAIAQIDTAPLIEGINAVANAAAGAAGYVASFTQKVDYLFKLSNTSKIADIDEKIKFFVANLGKAQENANDLNGRNAPDYLVKGNQSSMTYYANEIANLQKQREALILTERAARGLDEAGKPLIETQTKLTSVVGASVPGLQSQNAKFIDASAGAKEAAEQTKQWATALSSLTDQNNVERLTESIKSATEALDLNSFNKYSSELEDVTRTSILKGLDPNDPRAVAAAKEAAAFAADERLKAYGDALKEQTEKDKEAAQEVVDFFGDILTPMFNDSAQNFEDIFLDAAKRIAIGFGSELLASFTQSLGIDLSGLTSAQGLGQALAGQIFGTSSLAAGTKGIGPVADGAAYGSAITSFSFAPYIPAVVAATTAYIASDVYSTFKKGGGVDDLNPGSRAQLAITTGGFSEVAALFGLSFGGSNPDKLARRAARGQLQQTGLGENLEFQGVGGPISLFNQDYNVNGALAQQAVGVVNPLAQIFSKGDDKLGADLAGIFANATAEGRNFNEVLINASSLMEQMGLDAEDAKNQVTQLFLQGKITLEEFKADLHNLNIIASEDLVGPDSVSDSLRIAGEAANIPAVRIKGLGLAFNEMAQLGIDSTSEITQYVTEKFGPDIAAAFQRLSDIGIHSFEDIKNASQDQIAEIFSILVPLEDEFARVFTNTTDTATTEIGKTRQIVESQLEAMASKAREIGKSMSNSLTIRATLAGVSLSNLSGGNSNPPLNSSSDLSPSLTRLH